MSGAEGSMFVAMFGGDEPPVTEPEPIDWHDVDEVAAEPGECANGVGSTREQYVVATRRGRVTWASRITPEPVVWAWRDDDSGRVPAGALSLAAGREGTGKSSFGIWLTARVTRGELPGSFHGTPRRVLYVAVEDSWKHTLVPRLMAAGADLDMVGRFDVLTNDDAEVTLSLPHDNEILANQVRAHEVALVVIDPLMSAVGAGLDTHKEREVRRALDPLARIADDTGCVILGIAHFNKSGGSDAASLITGSAAFRNVPRAVFGFARDDSDGSRVMTQVKNSLGREDLPSLAYVIEAFEIETPKGRAETSRFAFTGRSDRSVRDIIRDGGENEDERGERDAAMGWLRAYLAGRGGHADAGTVIKAAGDAGISKSTLTRARMRARIGTGKGGMADGWVWSLPEESTKGPKNSAIQDTGTLDSSVSSVNPSPSSVPLCNECGHPLDPDMAALGETTHPLCDPEAA